MERAWTDMCPNLVRGVTFDLDNALENVSVVYTSLFSPLMGKQHPFPTDASMELMRLSGVEV